MTINLILLLSLFIYSPSLSQNYEVSILGIEIAVVKKQLLNNEVKYSISSSGLLDLLYPFKNNYTTSYDTANYNIVNFKKVISQTDYKSNLEAKFDSSGKLIYDKKHSVEIPKNTKTIFSLLSMIEQKPYLSVDTKWFNYEHEGEIGRARFIWADSSFIWNENDSLLCDHYRLDLELEKPLRGVYEKTDYFMKNIIVENITREVWVSKKKPRKIILASIKSDLLPFPIKAKIKETVKE